LSQTNKKKPTTFTYTFNGNMRATRPLTMYASHNFTRTTTPQPFYGLFFRDHPGESVPEVNFWTLRCKGRLTQSDTSTIQLGATPSGLTSAHLRHPPQEQEQQ